ncbi:MAG TPA: hypothetical protein VLB79_05230 [Solirubrobacterales bacterium]|nr:hypothetical protein [Solirubrobacterales bacterium]
MSRLSRHLPLLVFAVLALVVALAGAAFGGSNATTPKTVKRIATQQINRLAPGLSVGHATTADNATSAGNAANAANAGQVDGADVCSRSVNVPPDSENHPLCAAGPLIVSALCVNGTSTTEAFIDVSSTQSNSWVFGTSTDGSTVSGVGEPFLLSSDTIVDVTDNSTVPSTGKGGGASLSVGAADGSSISGTFSVRADHTATDQGTCFATVGATTG